MCIQATMFDATFFTCVMQELQKKHNVILESEIIESIFDTYNYENIWRQNYNKNHLFELMFLRDKYKLKCPMNKIAIIDDLVKHKIEEFLEANEIKWDIQKIRRQDYNIVISNLMEIYNDDIIKLGDRDYIIHQSLYKYLPHKYKYARDNGLMDDMCVILYDLETDKECYEYTAQEFMDLFEIEDVTYVKSQLLDWLNLL